MNRRLITYVLLCTSILVVVAAQISFRRPAMWRWLEAQPAAVTETTQAPASQPVSPSQARRAPYPITTTLNGAADMEPFLAPAKDALPEWQASAKAALDADARYHLLSLAKDAAPHALENDARRDIRYQALLQNPTEYRGELVQIQGDLISLGEPMELHRKLPGIEVYYRGLMTNERPEQQYLVLFTDLPPVLTTNKSQWNQLYIRQTQFSGYYYKVAKFISPKDPGKSWMLPVLVGKSPVLPDLVESSSNWMDLITVFLIMAIPVVLIALFVPRFFKKRDTEHDLLMQQFRQRREQSARTALDRIRDDTSRDLRLPNDRG